MSVANAATIGRRQPRGRLPRGGALARIAGLVLLVAALMPAGPARAQEPAPAPEKPEKTEKTEPAVKTPPKTRPAAALRVVFPRSLIASGLAARLVAGFREGNKVAIVILPRKSGLGLAPLRDGSAELAVTDDVGAERRFVADKHGFARHDIMYTEMIVVGPKGDPADIDGMISVIEAFKAIASSSSPFLGRNDGSGVALAERRFWREAGIRPDAETVSWFSATRADMRTTLLRAAKVGAYTLTDRPTWLALPTTVKLSPLVADDPRLQLRYGVVIANPAKRKGFNLVAASAFAEWLSGKEAQKLIETFKIGDETPYIPESGLER